MQLQHAEMHFTPFFLQLHLRLLQSPLQLQVVNFSSSSGAMGSKVGIGSYHELVLSIHSQWGPKTCSATEANLGFGDRHGGNAVQLHPLLEVEPPA